MAREEMAAEQERLRAETGQQIAKIQAHAEQEIASAGKAARQQLKEHAADLALKLAEQKIRTRMTAEAQDRLLGAFTEGLARQAPPPPSGEVN
jgi:F0F1-type ATP synthase membrane subunit b/b'